MRVETAGDALTVGLMVASVLAFLLGWVLLLYEAYVWLRYGEALLLSVADFGVQFSGSWVGLVKLGNLITSVPLFILLPVSAALVMRILARAFGVTSHR